MFLRANSLQFIFYKLLPIAILSFALFKSQNTTTSKQYKQMSTSTMRGVQRVIQGMKTSDGAGVRLTRSIGGPHVRNLDPFLMLDEIKSLDSDAIAGFPSHPHRGFETCTIMITGKMQHKDSFGNEGLIEDGGVQYMSAGRGIIHSEMPIVTGSTLHGYQAWINLPAALKMTKPRYQDIQADAIPTVEKDGVRVRVLSGEFDGTRGPVTTRHPVMIYDVRVPANCTFRHSYPAEYNSFAWVSEGAGKVNGNDVERQHAVIFEKDTGANVEITARTDMHFLLFAGKPIGEPIVQHGPFVMNTRDEIFQAFMDYEKGRLQNPDDDVWAAE